MCRQQHNTTRRLFYAWVIHRWVLSGLTNKYLSENEWKTTQCPNKNFEWPLESSEKYCSRPLDFWPLHRIVSTSVRCPTLWCNPLRSPEARSEWRKLIYQDYTVHMPPFYWWLLPWTQASFTPFSNFFLVQNVNTDILKRSFFILYVKM